MAVEKTSLDELVEKKEVKIPPETLKEIEELKATINVTRLEVEEERECRVNTEKAFNKSVGKLICSDKNCE